jgi:uncharacterized protein
MLSIRRRREYASRKLTMLGGTVDLLDLVAGTEAIQYSECRELLAEEQVGRVGVVVDGVPDIFPVNYGIDGDGIVFRTNEGRKLRGLLGREVVFEVDHLDRETCSGWSVVVHGRAQEITQFDSPALRERAPTPWTGAKKHLVRIAPSRITGRRVVSSSAAD